MGFSAYKKVDVHDTQVVEQLKKIVTRVISQNSNVHVLCFGSLATGAFNEESDIDIASKNNLRLAAYVWKLLMIILNCVRTGVFE